ncbi:38338_t:CDS:1, partial [Gigaspora margarita]
QILEITPLEYSEHTINFDLVEATASQLTELYNEPSSSFTTSPQEIFPRLISTKMQEIMDYFEDTILHQFPCVPCSFCSKLMYPEKSEWIMCDPNFQYL